MTTISIGIFGCILMLAFLFASLPVALSLAIVGGGGFLLVMNNPTAAYHLMASVMYDTFNKYDYSVIALFILMGQIAYHSGISQRLFRTAYCWLGWLPGGLGVATIGACAAFGAICGSGPATAATMAAVTLPEMKARKYSLEMSAGAVAAAGSLGMLIPPSVVFIVYGIITEISPAKLFVAGVLPGVMITLIFSGYFLFACWRHPELGPATGDISWPERWKSLGGVIETLLLFLLVIGGMFIGFFTPTEAAAIGAAGSLVIAAFRRKLSWKMLWRSSLETMRTSCMVLMIIAGALIFGRFLAVTRIPEVVAQNLVALPLPGFGIIICILIFYVILGTIMDSLALVMMTVPIFFPVVKALGFDPIWFGVMIVTIVQIGVITPPVGVNAYVVSGMMREISLSTVFRGCVPYVLLLVISSLILMIFPQIALWLPRMMG